METQQKKKGAYLMISDNFAYLIIKTFVVGAH